MFFSKLVIPMRAQPFHIGHECYLREVSTYCEKGVVILCRDLDSTNNPFSLTQRSVWINQFLFVEKILNLRVADRDLTVRTSRAEEYPSYFNDCAVSDITVFTTNETDPFYRSEGFQTFNHHRMAFVNKVWKQRSLTDLIMLEGTGAIIREKLRCGELCDEYLNIARGIRI